MMKVAIVHESMFGNTESLAADVMAGLVDTGADVVVADVGSVPAEVLVGCDLLVLAAPTHALTLSRPESRAEAVGKGADPTHGARGLREWLAQRDVTMPATEPRPSIAVFDTRMGKGRHWPGSAARSVERTMRRSGFTVVARTSFYVEGITGPIADGESERAREWGRGLAGTFGPSGARPEAESSPA